MGTWHLPKNEKQKSALNKKLTKLRKLKESILLDLGDDTALDHFEFLIERIEKFCTHLTKDCIHFAFLETENGLVAGVCKHCRSNVKE